MKSMLKFRDIILGKKDDSPDSSQKKGDAKQGEDSLSPVAAEQVKILMELYQEVPCNPKSGDLEKRIKNIVKSLQGSSLLESIRETFSDEQVKEWKEQSQKEFDEMGKLNRARMESLIEVADEGMRQVVYESIFIFDVNPSDQPNLDITYKKGVDPETGKPMIHRDRYHVFCENAMHGIDGIDRWLPEQSKREGEGNWMAHLQEQFGELVNDFGKSEKPIVQTLSTIGSLGGIGHKPDSDVDAQVIFGTEPRYEHNWTDADFFIALAFKIISSAYDRYLLQFPEEKREQLKQKVKDQMIEEHGEALSPEQQKIIDIIFPSTYTLLMRKTCRALISKMEPGKQMQFFWSQIPLILRKLPEGDLFRNALILFFPFLKNIPARKLQGSCFPNSVTSMDANAALGRLIIFYRDRVLGQRVVMKLLEEPAKAAGVEPAKFPPAQQRQVLMEHLKKNPSRGKVVQQFLEHVSESYRWEVAQDADEWHTDVGQQVGLDQQMLEVIQSIPLKDQARKGFLKRMVDLVNARVEQEAIRNEAAYEPGTSRKIYYAEEYELAKYPAQEAHYFVNILRKQRAGQHTPFLVSPEGSMAYSNMLNDLLLNPATLLCGLSPMPFSLPEEVKILSNIGVFPDWEVTQHREHQGDEEPDPRAAAENQETFKLRNLPNWGNYAPSREVFLTYVIPIFLRESEKISHRNLPKALLNTWWIEMLTCDEDTPELTSLTKLLIFPNDRAFIKKEMTGPYVDIIKSMEEEFPQLVRDPWWIKFTEMLMRFQDPEVQKEMLFCFAQHIRASDVIDLDTTSGEPIYLDKNSSWRFKAVHRFYTKFYAEEGPRIDLMKFSQGRDDVAQEKETVLKKLFLNSMKNTERRLIQIGNQNTINRMSQYISQVTKNNEEKERVEKILTNPLDKLMDRMLIVDMSVVDKAQTDAELNVIEKRQIAQIQDDRRKVGELSTSITKHYGEKLQAELNKEVVEKIIFQSRVPLAGDPLENVIFKYHFEKNFNRRPFQVPLPISKSLCIPRNVILLEFEPKKEKWKFKAMISKKAGGSGGNQLEMFQSNLVEGVTRCVFSKYIGFDARAMTSFQKNAVSSRSVVASNPVTADDLQNLAGDIKSFCKPIRVSSTELLENIYYLYDVMIVCNVDRPLGCAAIVRTNFDEQFVFTFDLNKTPTIEKDPGLASTKNQPMHTFYQRFNSLPARKLYWEAFNKLNLPMSEEQPPKLKIWVNPGSFNLNVTPKYQRVYLNGIAENLWKPEHVWKEPADDAKFALIKDFDEIGKQAITDYQQNHE
jgi:hypothetical protein